MRNPFLRNRTSIFLFGAVWCVLAILQTAFLYLKMNLPFGIALVDAFLSNGLFAEMVLSYWYTVRFISLDYFKLYLIILNHLMASVVFIGLFLLLNHFLLNFIYHNNELYISYLNKSFSFRAITAFILYFFMVLIYYLSIYYRSFQKKSLKEVEYYKTIKETELNALKSQLQPHFIFNSLNSINSLVLTSPEKAQDMIVNLSHFFRKTLDLQQANFSTLKEELAFSHLYLEIEKIRFGEKLLYQEVLEDEVLEIAVPNLVLQPLLENAIKFGVSEALTQSIITLQVQKKEHFLYISVSNTVENDLIIKKGKGIGLFNLKKRLTILYGRKDLLQIIEGNGVFEVKLLIPLTSTLKK